MMISTGFSIIGTTSSQAGMNSARAMNITLKEAFDPIDYCSLMTFTTATPRVISDSLPYGFWGYYPHSRQIYNPYTDRRDYLYLRMLDSGKIYNCTFSKATYAPHLSGVNFTLTPTIKLNITSTAYDKNSFIFRFQVFNEGITDKNLGFLLAQQGNGWNVGARNYKYDSTHDALSDSWTTANFKFAVKADVKSSAHTFNLSFTDIENQLRTGIISNVTSPLGSGESYWYGALQFNFVVEAGSSYVFQVGWAVKNPSETYDPLLGAEIASDAGFSSVVARNKIYWNSLLATVPQKSNANDNNWWWSWKELLSSLYNRTSYSPYYGISAFKANYREFAWDNPNNSPALVWYNASLAEQAFESIFEYQGNDGGIIHDWSPWGKFNIVSWSQPPVIVQNLWQIYLWTHNNALLANIYPKLEKYLNWWFANRDTDGDGVYEYAYAGETVTEGGDQGKWYPSFPCESVDLNGALGYEMKLLSRIADLLGNSTGKTYWENKANMLKRKMQIQFWDEAEGFYFNTVLNNTLYKKPITTFHWSATFIFGIEDNTTRVNMVIRKIKDGGFWNVDGMYLWYPIYHTAIRGLHDLGMTKEENEITDLLLQRDPSIQDAIWGWTSYLINMVSRRAGLRSSPNNIKIQPVKPAVTIMNLRIRNALWNIIISGDGNCTSSLKMDGLPLYSQIIPSIYYERNHTLEVVLGDRVGPLLTDTDAELESVSYTSSVMIFRVSARSDTTSTTKIYTGELGVPKVSGASSWSYDTASQTVIVDVSLTDPQEVILDWTASILPRMAVPYCVAAGIAGLGFFTVVGLTVRVVGKDRVSLRKALACGLAVALVLFILLMILQPSLL